jgi:hypothetical protein
MQNKINLDSYKNLTNVIALGAPFWGSATANNYRNLEKMPIIGKSILKEIPLEQLKRLAIGGKGTTWQRSLMINRDPDQYNWKYLSKWDSRYGDELEFYSVGALSYRAIKNLSLVKRKFLDKLMSPKRYKQDTVVGLPESRPDFYFNLENVVDPENPFKGLTSLGKNHFVVDSLHTGILMPHCLGVAYITLKNYSTHPSYIVIDTVFLKYFNRQDFKNGYISLSEYKANKDNFEVDKSRSRYFHDGELLNFTSEIKIILPKGYHRPIKIEKNQVQIKALAPKAFSTLRLKNSFWANGSGFNEVGLKIKNYYGQSYYHIGKFSSGFGYNPRYSNFNKYIINNPNGFNLTYNISPFGFKLKTFSTKVYPSLNSYTEIFITPNLPYKKSNIINFDPHKKSCRIGIVGNMTPFDGRKIRYDKSGKLIRSEEKRYFRWREIADNQLKIYRTVDTPLPIKVKKLGLIQASSNMEYTLAPGTPLEVIGRYATSEVDRYAVTSPEIRLSDGLTAFSEISLNRGVRFVDVKDIDIDKDILTSSGVKRTFCLKDDEPWNSYLSPKQYKKIYY